MPDLFDESAEQVSTPADLCRQAFSRCSNWPQELAGQIGLAQGLKLAADRYRLTQQEIVQRCRELSAFCPTDFDILRVAGEIVADRDRKRPGAAPWMHLPKCATCSDTGWAPRQGKTYSAVERCPNGCQVPDQGRFGGNI